MKDQASKHLLYAVIVGFVVLAVAYFWSISLQGGVAMIMTAIIFVYYELRQEIREIATKEEDGT